GWRRGPRPSGGRLVDDAGGPPWAGAVRGVFRRRPAVAVRGDRRDGAAVACRGWRGVVVLRGALRRRPCGDARPRHRILRRGRWGHPPLAAARLTRGPSPRGLLGHPALRPLPPF